MTDKALRYNEGKPELSYILDFNRALAAVAAVSQQGAIKYERGNWKKGGKPDTEYLDAALRHLVEHQNSGPYDPDIGTLHIANAVWNLLALLELNMMDQYEAIDPEFDQDAFKARYSIKPGRLPGQVFIPSFKAEALFKQELTNGSFSHHPVKHEDDDVEEGVGC